MKPLAPANAELALAWRLMPISPHITVGVWLCEMKQVLHDPGAGIAPNENVRANRATALQTDAFVMHKIREDMLEWLTFWIAGDLGCQHSVRHTCFSRKASIVTK